MPSVKVAVPVFEKFPVPALPVRPGMLASPHLSSLLVSPEDDGVSAQPAGKSATVRSIAFAAGVSSIGVAVGDGKPPLLLVGPAVAPLLFGAAVELHAASTRTTPATTSEPNHFTAALPSLLGLWHSNRGMDPSVPLLPWTITRLVKGARYLARQAVVCRASLSKHCARFCLRCEELSVMMGVRVVRLSSQLVVH